MTSAVIAQCKGYLADLVNSTTETRATSGLVRKTLYEAAWRKAPSDDTEEETLVARTIKLNTFYRTTVLDPLCAWLSKMAASQIDDSLKLKLQGSIFSAFERAVKLKHRTMTRNLAFDYEVQAPLPEHGPHKSDEKCCLFMPRCLRWEADVSRRMLSSPNVEVEAVFV